MPTVQELYELWAEEGELEQTLTRSLEPRGTESLYEVFAALGPQPGDVVLDAGCRDANHAIKLVREHGVRAIAVDPLPIHAERARKAVDDAELADEIEVVEAGLEALPFADASVDWIWCRDVLVHVDVRRGLGECVRVLRPGGAMVAYVTVATDRLEPRESDELSRAIALTPDGFDARRLEAAASDVGFETRAVTRLGPEWRERMIENGDWNPAEDLLQIARLGRRRDELVAVHGAHAVEVAEAGLRWGIYQLLGKLCPTIYVWERRA